MPSPASGIKVLFDDALFDEDISPKQASETQGLKRLAALTKRDHSELLKSEQMF